MTYRASRWCILGCAVLWAGLSLTGCQSGPVRNLGGDISISEGIRLFRIGKGVWVRTTYFDLPDFGRRTALKRC